MLWLYIITCYLPSELNIINIKKATQLGVGYRWQLKIVFKICRTEVKSGQGLLFKLNAK